MTDPGTLIVEAARKCLGTPFRSQGRLAGVGLDCVGVVLLALSAVAVQPLVPVAYRISSSRNEAAIDDALGSVDMFAVERGATNPGDVIIYGLPTGQSHLAIATLDTIIHAHLGLGLVVEGIADPSWERRRVWRLRIGG